MNDTAEKVLTSDPAQKALSPVWTFKLPNGIEITPNYIQVILVILMIFMVVLVVARLRKKHVSESLRGASGLVMLGFVLAIVLEALLLLGGRTLFTELIGWENAPKPISTVLDAGRVRLVDVLGASVSTVPSSEASEAKSSTQVLQLIHELPADQKEEVFNNFCAP